MRYTCIGFNRLFIGSSLFSITVLGLPGNAAGGSVPIYDIFESFILCLVFFFTEFLWNVIYNIHTKSAIWHPIDLPSPRPRPHSLAQSPLRPPTSTSQASITRSHLPPTMGTLPNPSKIQTNPKNGSHATSRHPGREMYSKGAYGFHLLIIFRIYRVYICACTESDTLILHR